jgi:hypothetical protein
MRTVNGRASKRNCAARVPTDRCCKQASHWVRQRLVLLRKTKDKIKSNLHNFADRVELRTLIMRIRT